MFWFILLGISAGIMILGIILWRCGKKTIYSYGKLATVGVWFTAICGIVVFISALVCSIGMPLRMREVATFERQKEYFEAVVPTLEEGENYALTQKKIELNEWLYEAQYEKKKYSFLSLYPDKVLKFEEIK